MKSLRLFLFIVGLVPTSSFAAVIDQSNLYEGPFVLGLTYGFSSLSVAQSFTVGLSGILDSVAVQLARDITSPDQIVAVSIFSIASGLPTGNSLAYTEFNAADSVTDNLEDPTTLVLDFSDFGLDVSAGEQLAIVVSTFGNPVFWLMNGDNQGSNNPYADGESLSESNDGSWSLFSDNPNDFAFETYVTPVPLPAAFLLMLSGILALAFAGRPSRLP